MRAPRPAYAVVTERPCSPPRIATSGTSDAGRRAIAEAVSGRIVVLRATDLTFTLTAHARARGWDAAFGVRVVSTKEGQSGRGERGCPATTDLPVIMRLAEPPEPCEWLRSA
jgi:hypothetical protein